MPATVTSQELFAGRFRLEEELGSGAIGRVFRAFDVVRQDAVALKILHDDVAAAASGLSGMVPLLRSIGRLSHPALRHLHDFNEWQGQIYLSLELLKGRTLDALLREGRRWTVPEAAALLLPVVEALEHARPQGPHRAIRPGHLFCVEHSGTLTNAERGTRNAELGQVKLADHGLAVLLTREQQVTDATLRGHAAYLAPEILTGADDGGDPADMFALGQVWLALVRGEPLLPGTPATVMDELPRSREAALLRRLLAPRPADRPGSWNEVRAALAPTESGATFTRKILWPRLGWVAAFGAVVVLVGLFGLVRWSVGRSRPALVAVTPEELRVAWAAWDETRLRLLAQAATEPKLLPIVQAHFAPMRDWTLARDWWRAESAGAGDTTGRAVQTLAELGQEAAGAQRTLTALPHFRRLAEAVRAVTDTGLGITNLPVAEWDATQARAVEAFQDRRFAAAAEELECGLAQARARLAELWMDREARARTALSAWRAELTARGLPVTEPNRDLSAELMAAKAAHTTNGWVAALTGLHTVEYTAAAWCTELAAVPALPTGQRENSLGMRFVRVGALWVSVWETRVLDFAAFIADHGRDSRYYWRREATNVGPTHPVTMITPQDALGFCEWLTARERAAGRLATGELYRLPTDAEWSAFASLPPEPEADPEQRGKNARDHWPWGVGARDSRSGNYHTPPQFLTLKDSWRERFDPFLRTSPASSFPANPLGLFDLGGNVWEFVSDPIQPDFAGAPRGGYTVRGGGFFTAGRDRMRSAYRAVVENNDEDVGFRVVLAGVGN